MVDGSPVVAVATVDEAERRLRRLYAKACKNVVMVAMANKLARIARAVLRSGNDYKRSVGVAQHNIAERRLRLESATRTKTTNKLSTAVAQVQKGRRSSHNGGAPSVAPRTCLNVRSAYKDGYARNSLWPGALISTQRPNTFAQTCLFGNTSP